MQPKYQRIHVRQPCNLRTAVKNYGKTNGYDDSCNEMLISLARTYPKVLLKLFNNILESSEVIPDWALGMIVPLHKDGPRLDPNNYRGITLISCLGKLFLSIFIILSERNATNRIRRSSVALLILKRHLIRSLGTFFYRKFSIWESRESFSIS